MLETLILAAGKGTRMKSKIPKVLHKVGGKAMFQHVIDAAKRAGSSREVVIIGSGAELVEQTITGVEFVLQAEQLGTGHAVLSARKKIFRLERHRFNFVRRHSAFDERPAEKVR